jgi:lipopolysaccharide/colanic/teichoic acid biosynthesis glycosyltransferase
VLTTTVAERLETMPVAPAAAVASDWPAVETPEVFEQHLFRSVLRRERLRCDRFEQPFALAVIARRDGRRPSPAAWAGAARALTTVKRGSDVVGWLDHEAMLGIILPGARPSALARIEERITTELSGALGEQSRDGFIVRLFLYDGPDPAVSRESPVWVAPPVSRSERLRVRLKRALDVAGSASLLAISAPLFLLIAALVKLGSSGPVLFRQRRVGRYGVPFTMLKFRTMHVNVDHAIHERYVSEFIAENRAAATNGSGQTFKIVNDPRVTRIGRFLRKTSLDELPQFWNVLRGEMSLVGPRPPLQYEVNRYKGWHRRRLFDAQPGITGLWQVTGRSRTTFDEMVRLDLRYAKQCSAWTDIKILLATPRAVVIGKGAC